MFDAWTIPRATGIGLSAGLVGLVLWPIYAAYQQAVLWPFLAVLGVAGFCGVSILSITAGDMLSHRRGARLRPVRAFDIIVGLVLALVSIAQLIALLPEAMRS